MAAAAPVMAAASIGAGAVSAYSQIEQGRQQKDIAGMNAAQDRQDAIMAQQAAKVQADEQRLQGVRLAGTQQATAAGNGLAMSGSILDVMADSARKNELDALRTEYQGKVQAAAFEKSAKLQEYQGHLAVRNAAFGAVSTVLGAGAKAGSSYFRGSRGVTAPTSTDIEV